MDVAAVQLVEGSRLAGGEAAAEALVGKPLGKQRAHVIPWFGIERRTDCG
jgi:hypothetical protein